MRINKRVIIEAATQLPIRIAVATGVLATLLTMYTAGRIRDLFRRE